MPNEDSLATVVRRTPWNKGKLIGAKPPLRPNQVWSIRTRLLLLRSTLASAVAATQGEASRNKIPINSGMLFHWPNPARAVRVNIDQSKIINRIDISQR
jgi:hypothetical protein